MRGATARPTRFDAPVLARRLRAAFDAAGRRPKALVVAWSGGADSTALLAALVELRRQRLLPGLPSVRALHVDHGLQDASGAWARRCVAAGRRWRMRVDVLRVRVRRERGESPEAAARDARHAAFASALAIDEWLLLAHHADDQLETTLLRWLRGAGASGLAGMRESRACGQGRLLRPLLDVPRDALRAFLVAKGVEFVEDPSNADLAFDRNYLRASVLPPLLARWPAAARTSVRAARHLDALQRDLDVHTRQQLDAVRDGCDLSLPLLRRLPPQRRASALRAWIAERGARAPDELRLQAMLAALDARDDARSLIAWDGYELRRHDARLTIVAATTTPTPTPTTASTASTALPDARWDWSRTHVLNLPSGRLCLRSDAHGDVDLDALPATLFVRGRPYGHERDAGGSLVDVKRVLQEARVPAWRRAALPFVHVAPSGLVPAALVAIADLWLSGSVKAGDSALRRGRFVWQPR